MVVGAICGVSGWAVAIGCTGLMKTASFWAEVQATRHHKNRFCGRCLVCSCMVSLWLLKFCVSVIIKLFSVTEKCGLVKYCLLGLKNVRSYGITRPNAGRSPCDKLMWLAHWITEWAQVLASETKSGSTLCETDRTPLTPCALWPPGQLVCIGLHTNTLCFLMNGAGEGKVRKMAGFLTGNRVVRQCSFSGVILGKKSPADPKI